MRQQEKQALRQAIRQQRKSLSEEQRQAAAEHAATHLGTLPGWAQASSAGLYLPADGEMPTSAISAIARERHLALYLPVLSGQRLIFRQWLADHELTANRYGIPEPGPDARERPPGALDILLMPLVAWDRAGNRLGMGGGYYDRSLAETTAGPMGESHEEVPPPDTGRPHGGRPLLVGLAYAFQEVAAVPRDDWDISLDYVLTERELYRVA